MATPTTTDSGDPFYWSIDQVVQQFCNNSRPQWSPNRPPGPLPKPDAFEKALRDNDINGETLLTLDQDTLKNDLGIASLGSRNTIVKAVLFLRTQSRAYQQEHIAGFGHFSPVPPATPQPNASHNPTYAQSPSASRYELHSPFEHRPAFGLPAFNDHQDFRQYATHAGIQRSPLLQSAFASHNESFRVPQAPEFERTNPGRSATVVQSHNVEVQEHDKLYLSNDTTTLSNPIYDTANTGLREIEKVPQKDIEKASGFLDALEAGVDKSLLEKDATDQFSKSPKNQIQPTRPTESHKIVDGRRKVAPTVLSRISQERAETHKPAPAKPVGEIPNRSGLQCHFLYNAAHDITEVLYPTDADDDNDFSLISFGRPAGQVQYVAKVIKYALRQPVKTLPGSRAKYKVPYSKSMLISAEEPQYFTVYAPGLEPAIRKVEDFSKVQESLSARRKIHQRTRFVRPFTKTEDTSPASTDPLQSLEDNDAQTETFDYLLKKYPVNADDGEDLPLYGESGDEGEYDLETWVEIQDEIKERARTKDIGVMTREHVDLAINEAIDDFKVTWQNYKLPKVQMKAYHLWEQAAKANRRQAETDRTSFWIDRSNKAIKKFREAILKDVWYKVSEVKHQCQSLEESVFQREEFHYLRQVFTENHPPARPDIVAFQKAKNKARPDIPDGEELLESDSDFSIDEFITEDEETSDEGSIHHDAPDPANATVLARMREAASRSRTSPPDSIPPSHGSDNSQPNNYEGAPELASSLGVQSESPRKVLLNSPAKSSSIEQDIVSPVDRKRLSKMASSMKHEGGKSRSVKAFNILLDRPETPSSNYEDDSDDGDQDSDLDLPLSSRARYRDHGRTPLKAIDLTLSSSSSRDERDGHESSIDSDVRTPDLNPPDEDDSVLPQPKLITRLSNVAGNESSASSPHLILHSASDSSDLPDLDDISGIQNLEWDVIADETDRRRALCKAVYQLDIDLLRKLRTYTSPIREREKRISNLRKGLISLTTDKGTENQAAHLACLPLLFVTYVCHANMMDMEQLPRHDIQEAYEALQSVSQSFFNCLQRALHIYLNSMKSPGHPRKRKAEEVAEGLPQYGDFLTENIDSEGGEQAVHDPSSRKKRKREVKENEEARSQQLDDQLRIREEQRRKAILAERRLTMDSSENDLSTQVINTIEPYISLDPYIGRRAKAHQVDGISFMWREIIADPKQQGCLLAHTMGLGKTMQVISLLYTIAQCGKSSNAEIKAQIPQQLRQIRALILCPPSLIDNWHDELLMWTPEEGVLGKTFRFPSKRRKALRVRIVRTWSAEGGVLLLSYDTFRTLVINKSKTLNEEEHREMEDNLLNVPNIIVADEAHKMKNAASQLTMVAKRFRSFSRIALTGSPLNNHLEEYHTMIDWIAPGYLGNIIQFRAKYSEPINEGLHSDSSAHERRVCLRKLHVLKRDLDPKISRADISAIEKDMPSKTEFFITVPLTELQAEAYNILIDFVLGAEKTSNARLWSWLGILVLLCAHPVCFVSKLKSVVEGQADASDGSGSAPGHNKSSDDDDSTIAPDDVAPSDLDLTNEVKERAVQVFRNENFEDLQDSVSLSHRALIVKQIVEEARRIGDKTLIFSHSIPTLGYLEDLMNAIGCNYARIDGGTKIGQRQEATKLFNSGGDNQHVFLISMRAGGLGLNLHGANRVIMYDFSWNPSWEEQAIGRAYRLGQTKPVFVYRFRAGGTFEDVLYNKSVFKTQLFQRVVDKKNYTSRASKSTRDYLFRTQDVPQQDFADINGKDPEILDHIIERTNCIRNIELTETFQREEDEELTPEERKAADEEYQDQVLERNDPEAFQKKQRERQEIAARAIPQSPMRLPAVPVQLFSPWQIQQLCRRFEDVRSREWEQGSDMDRPRLALRASTLDPPLEYPEVGEAEEDP